MSTVVCARDVDAVASFVSYVLDRKSSSSPQYGRKHAIISLSSMTLFILPQDDLPPSISCCHQVVVELDDCRMAVERALQRSAMLVEEYIDGSQEIHVVQGPEDIKLVLMTRSSPETCPILLKWMRHNDAETSSAVSTKDSPEIFSPPVGVPINTLFPSILHNNTYHDIDPNSSRPIPFSTPHFKGTVLLLVKTSPLPPYHKSLFIDRNLTFEVQVQGQFTAVPSGTIYIGAEITKTMQLGLITRSLCNTILQYARTKLPLLHYSFGNDVELPHIVGPLFAMVDRIVITPPGESPPVLGSVLTEDIDTRKQRKQNTFSHSISVDNIYTFSTKTNNIDICEWMVVNIPLLRPLDLHTFWSNADLRLCSYIIPDSVDTKQHAQKHLQYIFNLELKHISNHPHLRHEIRENIVPLNPVPGVPRSVESATRHDDSDEEYFDAYEDIPPSPALSDIGDVISDDPRKGETLAMSTEDIAPPPTVIPSAMLEAAPIDTSRPSVFVPYTVNMADKQYFMFLLPMEGLMYNEVNEVLRRRSVRSSGHAVPYFALRTHQQWREEFKIVKCSLCSAQRMSKSELRRSELNDSYTMVMLQAMSDSTLRKKLVTFLTTVNPTLTDDSDWVRSSDKYVYCTSICRRVDQRCWQRECLYVTGDEVVLCKGAFSVKGAIATVKIVDILSVNEIRINLLNCNMYYLSINTFAKEYLVAVSSPGVLLQLQTHLQRKSNATRDNTMLDYKHILTKSVDWKLGDRVILNARRLCGRMHTDIREYNEYGPLEIVERALNMILSLCDEFQRSGADNTARHIEFMNTVARLSSFNLATVHPSQEELLCLYLNLYHTLLLHAFYVIGLPATVFKWPQFFNSYAYEAFGDVFTLAELEHCVLKSGLSPPNSLIAQALIPLNNTYSFALNMNDVRILWLLNCGSLSMPTSIPIYSPRTLNEQIEITLRETFDMQISISQKTIHLPQLSQWYMKDIIALASDKNQSSTQQMLSVLQSWCSAAVAESLNKLTETGSYNVKYTALNYQCRYLEKRLR